MGRHLYHSSRFGAKDVIGIDISNAVESAYKNTKNLPNVHVIQADMYKLPLADCFDFIYCISVLRHLPDDEKGFKNLVELLKENGLLFAWVSGSEESYFIYFKLRIITTRLSPKIVDIISLGATICIYPIIIGVYRPIE